MSNMNTHSVMAAMTARRSVGGRQLAEPGPNSAQIAEIVTAGAAAPDHGLLVPFRFLEILPSARERLADAFRTILYKRDANPSEFDLAKARNKATLGPVNIGLVAKLQPEAKVILSDQWLTVGGALQNMVLAAEAQGFAVAIRSGADFASPEASQALGLGEGEELVAILAVGSAAEKPAPRPKPALADVFVKVE